jgi:hypothetical protein
MNNNVFKVGAIVGAIAMLAPSVSAQSVFADRLLLAQTDSQGCVYYEKGIPGSIGQPAKVCKEPKFNGIRIDACLLAYGACDKKASGEEFCRLQGDGYTKYFSGSASTREYPPQTISITNGKIHQTKNLGSAPFSYKYSNNGRLVAFSSISCRKSGDVADNKPKKEEGSIDEKLCKDNGQYVVFAQRPLKNFNVVSMPRERGTRSDRNNIQLAHEHIFFCKDKKIERNIGFGPKGRFSEENISKNYALIDGEKYDTHTIDTILGTGLKMCYWDNQYGLRTNNCQDFTARVRKEYWKRKK